MDRWRPVEEVKIRFANPLGLYSFMQTKHLHIAVFSRDACKGQAFWVRSRLAKLKFKGERHSGVRFAFSMLQKTVQLTSDFVSHTPHVAPGMGPAGIGTEPADIRFGHGQS